MEELQTDTLSDYGKHQNEQLDSSKDNENGCAGFLNGCDEIDPLDLMDHCENQSVGSNSDVWKASDSEDEALENAANCNSKTVQNNIENVIIKENGDNEAGRVVKDGSDKTEECKNTSKKKQPEIDTDLKCNLPEDNPVVCEEQIHKETTSNEQIETELNPEIKTADEAQTDERNADNGINFGHEVKETPKTVSEGQTEEKDAECEISSNEPMETEVVNLDSDEPPNTSNIKEKLPGKSTEEQEDEAPMDYDEDDDFDPSLLCPEVSMAIDENPVIPPNIQATTNDDGDETEEPLEPLFSTFVDEITGAEVSFNLTAEEQELRKRLYGPTNPIQLNRIHCTACNVHLGSALEGQSNRFVHPMLKVLICKECYHFYTSGEFEKDEDGSELYCRWCGQGGNVLCCSKCEFVFCKRCIRTNFGRKKMFEIRDSDSWDCFRCAQSQITTQRISCYEFFEYIRREMSRVATADSPEIWSKDHSRCCVSKKRQLEDGEEVKKTKRKKDLDPDFTPESVEPIGLGAAQVKGYVPPKTFQFVPKLVSTDNDIQFVRQISAPTILKTPKPMFRPIAPSAPKFFRLAPPQLPTQLMTTVPRFIGGSILKTKSTNSANLMKHEWFEKTVRASARVNTHLSYTLTQLNKAQSQASSIEELAVVHNKLQEILSSSVNSLIQIRKNLRAEFIAGIKTVRLPPKKVENDDDVILVSAPALISLPSTSQNANKTLLQTKTGVTTMATTSYLKVKSVKDLQSVPSECITIPDDVPESPGVTKVTNDASKLNAGAEIDLTDDSPNCSSENIDVVIGSRLESLLKKVIQLQKTESKEGKDQTQETEGNVETVVQSQETESNKENAFFNVLETPNSDMKRMMSAYVKLAREDLEDLRKRLKH